MNRDKSSKVLVLGLTLFALQALAQQSDHQGFAIEANGKRLVVRPQTPAEAYGYLQQTLSQMSFFDANGYDVALPAHQGFDADGEIGSLNSFASEVYREADFASAMAKLRERKPMLQQALEWFSTLDDSLPFYVPTEYTVVLTLYGPGGSYNPESATITMLTTPDGRFKGGGGAHTIVHEMMHIATEETLVQRFELSHWEKERLVDVLCQRELGHVLKDYQLQPLGDAQLGEVITDVPLAGLAAALAKYRK